MSASDTTARIALRHDPELAALCASLALRHGPVDEVECHWIEELAFAVWRQRRLRALETAALDAAESTDEPDPRRPSLATLARYRARIERDLRLAHAELERARAMRPRLPSQPAKVSEVPAGTSGPEPAPVAATRPQPAARTNPSPILNRQQRRRLAALLRQDPASLATAA